MVNIFRQVGNSVLFSESLLLFVNGSCAVSCLVAGTILRRTSHLTTLHCFCRRGL